MSQMLSVYNNDIFTINMPNAPYEVETVIVLGAPRGGASMIAGSLHLLGIQMPEKQARFMSEIEYVQRKWGKILKYDPFYNRNLALNREDFSIGT